MQKVIIIGAGPAGLTAAIYALRAGKSVLLLEEKAYGGQIVNTPEIENYPGLKSVSGFEYATTLYEQAEGFGAELIYEKAVEIRDKGGIKTVKTDEDNEYTGRWCQDQHNHRKRNSYRPKSKNGLVPWSSRKPTSR